MGYPARVIAIDGLGATVELDGRRRRASTLFMSDICPGDWVLVAAGSVVDRLDPDEAQDIRATLLEAIARQAAVDSGPAEDGGRP